MPHKYVTPEVLTRLQSEITSLDLEIRNIRAISKKDKDGVELFLRRIKELLDSSKKKKDMALDGLMEDGRPRSNADGSWLPSPLIESKIQERMALIFRGEEKAFEAVIEMFENPEAATDYLSREKAQLEKQFETYSKMSVRENSQVA